jgi:hypothetical protein
MTAIMKATIALTALGMLQTPAAAAQEAPQAPPPEEPAVETGRRTTPTMDHLELDPTSITGNRELPKVMVIVPWKHSELGELQGRPANSLLNEILSPVDRDVFRRELRYFETLEAAGALTAAPTGAPPGQPAVQPEN